MTHTTSANVLEPMRTINEAIASLPLGEPNSGLLSFRCTKRLEAGLRRHALVHQVELSSLIRLLLTEAAEARGISLEL